MGESGVNTREEHFMSLIDRWQETEDVTIAHCEKILAATENVLLRTLAGLIKSDSLKHKEILAVISQTMEGTVTLTPDDLVTVSELISEHVEIERGSVALAMEQYEHCENFVVKQLLGYLLEDETKHFRLLTQLNDYKRHLYPYA